MIKRTLDRFSIFTATLGGATIILASASLASRVLGLLRDRLLASGFGAGPQLDIYYAAFRVPDFIFNILVWGAISAAFIPIFAGYVAKRQQREADNVGSTILTLALLVLIVAASVIALFAPRIMPLVAPGFTAQQLDEVVLLTRIMLLSPIFFGLSGIFGSILNTYQRFLAYAIAPLIYNIGIIVGALLAPRYGLVWLAIGVVSGAFLQMVVQLVGVVRTKFRFRPVLRINHPGVRKIFILMIPTTIGVAILQFNLLIETIIATTLRAGSLSQFMLATSLSMIPVGVVGASFATAAFPVLARAASIRDTDAFLATLLEVIRNILYVVIPASVAMMLLRAQIVRVAFGSGKFDFTDTRYVTSLLGILAVSLFAQALIPLLTRAFYSLRNTKTPVIISAACMVLNIVLALVASHYLGVVGLAVSFTTASIVQLSLLFFFLSAKVPQLEDQAMISAVTKMLLASLVMGVVIYGSLYGVAFLVEEISSRYTFAYFFTQLVVGSLLGAVVYVWLTDRMGLREARALLRRFRKA